MSKTVIILAVLVGLFPWGVTAQSNSGGCPTASTTLKGCVKPDGTTITVNNSGTITAVSSAPSGAAGGSLAGTYPNPSIAPNVALPGHPTTTKPASGSNNTQVATTNFVAQALAALNPATAVAAATVIALPNAPTYANGSSGVGATLTATSNGALVIDGYAVNLNDRLLINNQAAELQNGVYTETTAGSGSAEYVLTRAIDFNTVAKINNAGVVPVTNGTVNAGTTWALDAAITAMGTSAILYDQTNPQPPAIVTINMVPCTVGSACTVAAAPSGTAGGDLAGSYPNPGVAKINGGAVPTSSTYVGTNSSGQIVTAATPPGTKWNGYGMWQLTVPTGLTNWANQGTAVSETGTNFLSIAAPPASGPSLRVLNAACPSGFTGGTLDLYALIVISGGLASDGAGGIEFDDGTKYVTFMNVLDGGSSALGTYEYTNTTTYNATINSDGSYPIPSPVWLHVHDASGALTMDYSFDGVGTPGTIGGWRRITSSTSGFLSAVTNCGVFVSAGSASFPASVTVLSYAFASALTAQ